jgi:hypothetical protein
MPAGHVGMTPMDVRITPDDMRWYYNTWTRIRSIKPYMPVPYTVPRMGCHGPYMQSMRGGQTPSGCSASRQYSPMIRTSCNIPPGFVGDGPVTTRPPPLDDPAIDAADQDLEAALDDMDQAMAAGEGRGEANRAVEAARKALDKALKDRQVSEQDYLNAKAEEEAAMAEQAAAEQAAAAAAAEQAAAAAAAANAGAEKKDEGTPWWAWGLIAATTIGAGYAGYRYGGK